MVLESKEILAGIQKSMVTSQVQQFVEQNQTCPACTEPYAKKANISWFIAPYLVSLPSKVPVFTVASVRKVKLKASVR